MGSHTHQLLEFLQVQLNNNGRSLGRSIAEYYMSHLAGFLQENPTFTSSFPPNMAGEINPLVKLLYGEDKPQFRIHKLQDHLARIEMKVQQLESRVPQCLEQHLLVGAAEVDDDDYEEDEYEEDSHQKSSSKQTSFSKGSKQNGKDQKKGKEKKGKKKEEEKNCFARLLFSKCWSGNQGKNGKAGWNLKSCCYKTGRVKKGACPAYSTCPCGDDAPCAKIEKKSCPANEKKSGGSADGGKGKKKNGGEGGGGGSRGKKSEKMKKDENPLSALCGKCAPCIFTKKGGNGGESKSDGWCGSCNKKKHIHTPCCCRCKDNPALPEKDKSKQSSKSAKGSNPSQNKTKVSEGSYDDDDASFHSAHSAIILPKKDGTDPTQEPMRCVGCTDCDDIRTGGRKSKKGTMLKSEATVNLAEDYEKEVENRTTEGTFKVLSKSSTNFQVLLPPSISSESSDHNMVSHQILKTLSTIHGPIRVEQKIVVKGTKNAFVIVTHGEACECNICSTLKKDSIPTKTANDNPKVVRFPTGNGCDTLVNHSDNCECTLCSVLELGITEETPKTNMDKCQSRGVWASWSKSNVETTIHQSSESIVLDPSSKTDMTENSKLMDDSTRDGQNGTAVLKEHSRKNKEDYRKKKCHCLKCAKRRKARRLKKRLKHALEPGDVSQLLMELSHHGFTLEQDPDEVFSMNGDDDEDTSKVSRTSSKRVSFSSDTKVRRYGETKSSGSSDSKETVVPGDYKKKSERRELALATNVADNDRKRKSKVNREVKPRSHQKSDPKHNDTKSTSPRCKNSNFTSKPCACIVCKYSNSTSRGSTQSKAAQSRQNKGEEQACFPETAKVPSKCGCTKDLCMTDDDQLRENLLDKVIHPDDDFIRPPTRCEPGCKGRCRYLTPRDELNNLRNDQMTPVVLQASRERLPPKILYWIPSSPHLAAAFSSDSYYIPDLDEFPMRTDQSTTHSTRENCNNEKIESDSVCDIKRSRTVRGKHFH